MDRTAIANSWKPGIDIRNKRNKAGDLRIRTGFHGAPCSERRAIQN
jgi:hypothetical protein